MTTSANPKPRRVPSWPTDLSGYGLPLLVQLEGLRNNGALSGLDGEMIRFTTTLWLSRGDEIQLRVSTSPDTPVLRLSCQIIRADYTGRGPELECRGRLLRLSEDERDALWRWVDAAAGGGATAGGAIACGASEVHGGDALDFGGGVAPQVFAGQGVSAEVLTCGADGLVEDEDDSTLTCGDYGVSEPAPPVSPRADVIPCLDAEEAPLRDAVLEMSAPPPRASVRPSPDASDALFDQLRDSELLSDLKQVFDNDAIEELSDEETDDPETEAIEPRIRPTLGRYRWTLVWETAAGFLCSWRGGLSRGFLHLGLPSLQVGERVPLRLELPDGQVLALRGVVMQRGTIVIPMRGGLRHKLRTLAKKCEP